MGNDGKKVELTVFVDKKKNKVMFAEADEDFVEILFSFFTLPLGTIAKLSKKNVDSSAIKVGSLTSLYESIINLNEKHFSNEHCKDALINPSNSSASFCQKLKVNLDETKPIINASLPSVVPQELKVNLDDAVFFKKKASFIITDDLNVVPVMLDTSIVLLCSLGVEYIDLLERIPMSFGLEEFSNLLKWSLLTNNPLTNMVLGGSKPCPCSSCDTNSASDSALISINSSQNQTQTTKTQTQTQTQTMKLLIQKSTKKVLCAQVENSFVELLFSFLTIPLGAYERLTKDNSSSVGIRNLYNSISSLGDGKYLKSEDVKTMLLRPKLAANYLRVTNFLPIYEVDTRSGCFLKEQATFIVSDDLEVTVSPSVATITKFNILGVSVCDIEVREVAVGEHEALLILKASVTSTSVLTDCLNALKKKPKA